VHPPFPTRAPRPTDHVALLEESKLWQESNLPINATDSVIFVATDASPEAARWSQRSFQSKAKRPTSVPPPPSSPDDSKKVTEEWCKRSWPEPQRSAGCGANHRQSAALSLPSPIRKLQGWLPGQHWPAAPPVRSDCTHLLAAVALWTPREVRTEVFVVRHSIAVAVRAWRPCPCMHVQVVKPHPGNVVAVCPHYQSDAAGPRVG